MLFLKSLDKIKAGGISTILQTNIHSKITYHILKYLLYNKLMINGQANKHIIPNTEKTICIYTSKCVCMYVYPCIYTCMNNVLVCMHINIYIYDQNKY